MNASRYALDTLLVPGGLATELAGIVPAASTSVTAVALIHDGIARFAAIGPGGAMIEAPQEAVVHPGCMTKLFITSLIAERMASGALRLSDSVCDHLPHVAERRAVLAGIRLDHLLNHTHGLDASAIETMPVLPCGRIDTRTLVRMVADRRLYEPGRYYSYSSLGAWLLGAILEERSDRQLVMLLEEQLYVPLRMSGLSTNDLQRRGFCAARGGTLMLTLGDFAHYMAAHVEPQTASGFGQAQRWLWATGSVPMPGYTFAESAVRGGWKCYGDGWFGHNAMQGLLQKGGALIRVHCDGHTAFLVSSAEYSPTAIAASLFGRRVPRLADLQVPRLLRPLSSPQATPERFIGTYANDAVRLRVDSDEMGGLTVEILRGNGLRDARTAGRISLRPAPADLFLCSSQQSLLPFLQFIGGDAANASHVWDGTVIRSRL